MAQRDFDVLIIGPGFGGSIMALGLVVIVMQNLDTSFTTYLKRGLFGTKLSSKDGDGPRNPTWLPIGDAVAERLAAETNSQLLQTWTSAFSLPMTVHFFGGAVIGDSPERGVVDPYHLFRGTQPSMWWTAPH